MSELTAPVARPGIPGLIGSWPQSRFWLLCVDLYPALAAASLPWSTTAVSIFMVLWLIVVRSHDPLAGVFRVVARTGQLPAAGPLRTGDGRPVLDRGQLAGWHSGPRARTKLLAVPLLLYHFERSERGHWVLFAFLASCVLLMGLSWLTYFADWKASPGGMAGVPVRNYIDQSHEFALCLFVMAPLLLSFAANGHRAWTWPLPPSCWASISTCGLSRPRGRPSPTSRSC